MGLLSKIDDKLSGSSNSSKLEKQGYDSSSTGTSGATSKLQNPISSAGGTTGTYGGTSTGTTSSSMPTGGSGSSYPTTTSGMTSTAGGASDRMPGSYVTDESHIPSSTGTSATPSKPYDPYSRSGQATAASAGTTGYSSSQARDFSGSSYEDPSVARSRDGGIMNSQTTTNDPRYGTTSSSQPLSSSTDPRYGTTSSTAQPTSMHPGYGSSTVPASSASQPTSSSHYGRDAAIAGGAGAVGAGGVGAYEYNKSSGPAPGSAMGQPQDVSYMSQSSPGGTRDPAMAGGATGAPTSPTSASSGGASGGASGGLEQAKKMGSAYEAGYRDGMEHMKQEMLAKGGSAI